MSKTQNIQHACDVCGKIFPARTLVSGAVVQDALTERILRDHPEWLSDAYICRDDLPR